jgi:hypothetical protein
MIGRLSAVFLHAEARGSAEKPVVSKIRALLQKFR